MTEINKFQYQKVCIDRIWLKIGIEIDFTLGSRIATFYPFKAISENLKFTGTKPRATVNPI